MSAKVLNASLLVTAALLLNLLYALAQDSAFAEDGQLNFNSPGAIAQAIDSGSASVQDLFSQGSTGQIESVFGKATRKVQSEILSFYAGPSADVAVNGKIESFSNGVITTESTSLNLNDFKNFGGTIAINEDGSITITPKTDATISVDGTEISSQSPVKITGKPGERIIAASTGPVTIKSPQGQVVLNHGSVAITSQGVALQENSEANFAKTRIESLNSKVDLGFNSGKNSYVLFDEQNRRGLLFGRDFAVEFFENSPYEHIDVDGNNIGVVNGGLFFIFNEDRIMEDAEIGRGVKNIILKNLQSDHKVGIAMDGGFVAYSDPKLERAGFYERYKFVVVHAYDAKLELDTKELENDYKVLVGDLPENPHESKSFQNFVVQHSDFIRLRLFPKVTYSQTADEIKAGSQEEIKRSGVAYTELQSDIRINDVELQSQREIYENFLISLKGSQDNSELAFTINNHKAFIEYYPNMNDRTNKKIVEFSNEKFFRQVLLPVWITERNNVEDMPAKLLCSIIKGQDVC